MGKILIVSDVHGDRAVLVDILNHWRNQVDAIFYNGDSELAADDSVFDGVSTVIGNRDSDVNFVEARSTTVDGVTFFQTHGHLYNARDFIGWANLTDMDQAANEAQAQVVLFGHTHQAGTQVYDHKLFINPGSTTLPMGEYASFGGSYAVLSIELQQLIVDFYNRQHQELPVLKAVVNRDQLK